MICRDCNKRNKTEKCMLTVDSFSSMKCYTFVLLLSRSYIGVYFPLETVVSMYDGS